MTPQTNQSKRRPGSDSGVSGITEFEPVRVVRDVLAEGNNISKDTTGTIVGVYEKSAAYAVEIANLPGGPEVVTLRAGRVECVR
ncbi:MAG TPA: hypothetical protein VMB73_00855 [Acetobacteraceae bacterium]|jgi:hypothetical protein|nr:hypothetical protein [Acetobacteraceae bacterium]